MFLKFNKIAGLKGCNFIKERLYYRCFTVEYYEIFKNSFFHRTPLLAGSISGNSREVRSNTLREDTNPKRTSEEHQNQRRIQHQSTWAMKLM